MEVSVVLQIWSTEGDGINCKDSREVLVRRRIVAKSDPITHA